MLFSSITFIYLFLPVVLLAYYAAPRQWKNSVLLLASLLFYFFGEPVYVCLLVFSSLSDWLHSLYIEKHRAQNKKAKRALVSSIVINLGMLGFFKYADFFISTLNTVLNLSIPLLNVPLPIGISFFTFQTMSYTIDVYRGEVKADRNLATFATYVCLFPQLIAGPIVRYTDIAEELRNKSISLDYFANGVSRFIVGLAKKVLIANLMGEFCAEFWAAGDKSVLFYWAYATAFSLQIYFDFSGYSDMAIGLGKMLGFTFLENFNYPYIARSITEFWRRWHISLSSWFRDYVYIPLGGSRSKTQARNMLNIFIVWMLTGFWHGAAWNFVLWGLLFAVLLVIEKLWLGKVLERCPKLFRHIYVLFLVLVSFVIFNASGLSGALTDIKGLFGLLNLPLSSFSTVYYLKSYAVLFAVAILCSTPLLRNLYQRLQHRKGLLVIEPVVLAVLLLAVTACLIDGSFNPFLYFRF